jgi:hypothetical protein
MSATEKLRAYLAEYSHSKDSDLVQVAYYSGLTFGDLREIVKALEAKT